MSAAPLEVDALTGEIVTAMDRDEALKITARIKGYAAQLPILLAEAHAGRAHASLGYGTWGEYVSAEFGLDRSRSYELIHHALVIRELAEATGQEVSAIADTVPESHSRELHRLPQGERAEAYEEAKAEAGDKPTTASNVRSIVDRRSESTSTTEPVSPIGDPAAPDDSGASPLEHASQSPAVENIRRRRRVNAWIANFHQLQADTAERCAASIDREDVEDHRNEVAAIREWLDAYEMALSPRPKAVK